ncbi:GNAT family N-acetyltransferase [bacterium]|nr:GNAT family N-acetyltransferase [bacterium]
MTAANSTANWEVSTDKSRLDRRLIHAFLGSTYWAAGISRETVDQAIEGSFCFGVFESGQQIAFARVITDHATFAWLADVFVVESHRGLGVGKFLVAEILANARLQNLRRWMLATLDAHGLYEQFGFQKLAHPERFLEIRRANPYGQPTAN